MTEERIGKESIDEDLADGAKKEEMKSVGTADERSASQDKFLAKLSSTQRHAYRKLLKNRRGIEGV